MCIPDCPSIHQLRQTVSTEHTSLKQQEMDNMPRASFGYGGKFGLQEDRMDKVRLSFDVLPTLKILSFMMLIHWQEPIITEFSENPPKCPPPRVTGQVLLL